MSSDSLRFGVVISHPIQHFSPLFRALAEISGIHVKVFYLCDHGIRESHDPGFGKSFAWDVPLLDGYDYEFLRPGFSPSKFGLFETDSSELGRRLDEFSPHALWIHGYGQMISWRALWWARGKAAVIYFGDSELLHKRSITARIVKYVGLRYFFRRCDAFLTAGDRNEEYYMHYGVPGEKLHRGACPVDVGRFRRSLSEPGRPHRVHIRNIFGIPENGLVALVIGKFVPIKRHIDMVKAVAMEKKRGVSLYALFIGDGPERKDIERYIRENDLNDYIKVTGFINQKEIPYYIEAGDFLVVPSEQDAHPLSVTESLIFGHPIIASDKVGCVGPTDTARPGVNALVYPCGDVQALARCIETLVTDDNRRKVMGEASSLIAPTQDVSVAVKTVRDVLFSLRKKYQKQWQDIDEEVFRSLKYMPEGKSPEAAQ